MDQLNNHRAHELIEALAQHVGMECDLIQFVQFLSLAAAAMGLPVNLDVWTSIPDVDLQIMRRILTVQKNLFAEANTHAEFRRLEHNNFKTDGATNLVVLVRSCQKLFHDALLSTAAIDSAPPSLWHVCYTETHYALLGSALRIDATKIKRDLDQYATAFSSPRRADPQSSLANVIETLPKQPSFTCMFVDSYRAKLEPGQQLVFERLLRTLAALRVTLDGASASQITIDRSDYGAARSILCELPLVPAESLPSPKAIEMANCLHPIINEEPRIELPDRSSEGATWFTRKQAAAWAGCGYSTAKKQLAQLQSEGIVQSTVAENNARRGKQQHYRFVDGVKPPFLLKNSFEGLPDLAGLPP